MTDLVSDSGGGPTVPDTAPSRESKTTVNGGSHKSNNETTVNGSHEEQEHDDALVASTLAEFDFMVNEKNITPRHLSSTEREMLEKEIQELEDQLRAEREDKRRLQYEAQQEIDRETSEAEDRWISKVKSVIEERDLLKQRNMMLDEQIEMARVEVNRAVAFRLELEDSRQRLQAQYDGLLRDYEETMLERSQVLEENNRLAEERDKLRQNLKNMSNALQNASTNKNDIQLQQMHTKLDQTRRLLHLNMEETASANARRNDILEELNKLREKCEKLEEEKNDALRRLCYAEQESEQITDQWTTHTVEISLPLPKPNLGVILSGGHSDLTYSTPIYVKDVLIGSPLESLVKRLDHIVIVNDIDVSDMDQRSVHDILRNSHHLKMVIRRRASLNAISEVSLGTSGDLGVELANGVFLNRVEHGGVAERCGLRPGDRLVLVNGVPVYDAKQAEEIAKSSSGSVKLGVLTGRKRLDSSAGQDTHSQSGRPHRSTLFSKMQNKLFGRSGEKPRPVIAKANIEGTAGEFYRHGSLRIPVHSNNHELVRTGSLRASIGSKVHKEVMSQAEHYRNSLCTTPAVTPVPGTPGLADAGSTWPKSRENSSPAPPSEALLRRRPPTRPSVFPLFAHNTQNTSQSCRTCNCASPLSLSSYPPSSNSIDGHNLSQHYPHHTHVHNHHVHRGGSPTRRISYTNSVTNAKRVSPYSPSLPQPPPYPGPRFEESTSSILSSILASSTNSMPIPSTSSVNYPVNNSPSETLLSDCPSESVRRVCLSKDGSEFGLDLQNSDRGVVIANVHGRANGLVKKGERLLDVGGINMRSADKLAASRVLSQISASQDEVTVLVASTRKPRWIQIPRKSVRLCGGNAIGIVAESSFGELNAGDLVLEIDSMDVRSATLEVAISVLNEGHNETVDLLVDNGGDRLERLRGGADGDGLYVRINIDRTGENGDELDIKAGEILFVDNTLFMGQRGRWRAWRVDREGRQRQCGIIPSAAVIARDEGRRRKQGGKALRTQVSITRPVYEKVERVNSSQRRPIVLMGAYTAPFTQALLDDAVNRFTQCVAECRALSPSQVDNMLATGELIDARKRDKLFDVVSTAALLQQMEKSCHVILDVSPQAIHRLHAIRVYPIIVKIKFKSAKQIKELYEDGGEKISSKTAKEMLEKAVALEDSLSEVDAVVSSVFVSPQAVIKTLVKHVCQQVIAHVDHEQRKTLWVAAQTHI